MGLTRHHSEFRFYEELNAFLPPARRKRSFAYAYDGTPAVKAPIEAIGVPHTEVDLILVDGVSVPFSHRLSGGKRVAVYPVFERFELADACRLRPRPLRDPRFVLDVHLGRLAGYMRLLGLDTLYRNDYSDHQLLAVSLDGHRVLLTRDTGLLKRAALTHGAFLHHTEPRRQLREVIDRFQLDARLAPFTRCGRCNGLIERVGQNEARLLDLPAGVDVHRDRLSRCCECRQLYWPGSHQARLRERLAQVGIPI